MNRPLSCHIKTACLRTVCLTFVCLASLAVSVAGAPPIGAQSSSASNTPQTASPDTNGPVSTGSELNVTVNKSIILDHAAGIRRVSITNPEIAEAVAVSSVELLINGKTPGDTSLILWDTTGARRNFDVHVVANDSKVEMVRAELAREVGPNAMLTLEGSSVFLRGTVNDTVAADRAASIAGTLGKVINLLRVLVPPEPPQILLKVRFADVDRSFTQQLGFNLMSLNQKGIANVTTTQFGAYPQFSLNGQTSSVNFSDLLNIFYFRPDLNLGAFIQALEAKNWLQMLAEPDLLTLSGQPASFLAGGEFPFPTIQGGAAGVGQITVQFKEYGVKLNFVPTLTPRGTIHLEVTPEVSSLDYSNGLTVSGYTVPGLATRRVQTDVELQDGQSFMIAGLLNKQVTEQLNKMPGIGDIPVLGKLFQSRQISKSDSELLVIVTPQVVHPMAVGVKPPEIPMPLPFLPDRPKAPQNPAGQPGQPPLPSAGSLPLEQMKSVNQPAGGTASAGSGSAPLMVVQPVQLQPAQIPGAAPPSQPPAAVPPQSPTGGPPQGSGGGTPPQAPNPPAASQGRP